MMVHTPSEARESTAKKPVSRCLIVGEVAQAHDGSLGLAHAFIDAIAVAGADGVKFQTHIAAAESTRSEPWRIKFSRQDETRYEYWQRTSFTESQWAGLKRHADDLGLVFLSSPFSTEAVELLSRIGIEIWKVASGEVSNLALLERILETQRPVIVSSGMSTLAELDAAVKLVRSRGVPLTIAQCTSIYPCPAENVGLNLIPELRARFQCPVGLSDHSGTIFPAIAAATLGIEFLEVHVTMSREMFGPDVASSVTTTELRMLVEGVRFVERMQASPIDKDIAAAGLLPLRELFTKSVVAACSIPAGTVLSRKHLALKKPGKGIPAAGIDSLIGRTASRAIAADEMIATRDLV